MSAKSKRWTEDDARRMIAYALTETEGRVIEPAWITFNLGEVGSGGYNDEMSGSTSKRPVFLGFTVTYPDDESWTPPGSKKGGYLQR